MEAVTARACANIALVKYWGKRDALLNLPAAGSLSLTLAALASETTVRFDEALEDDELVLDGTPASTAETRRITAFLDLIRAQAGIPIHARVTSRNNFPTASGLASSASGFAALAVAAARAAGMSPTEQELSILARRGSGSAARSIFGGFVRMHAGTASEDAYAEPIESPLLERVRMVIAVVGGGVPKSRGSTDAMDHTAATSPMYRAWLELVPRDLAAAEEALAAGDLERLGAITEANALAMHATAITARPPVVYWRPATLAVLEKVRGLRECGVAAWATMDAGPHVKVLTTADDASTIAMQLRDLDGVTAVTISAPGGPAAVIEAAGDSAAVIKAPGE
jgi:diphosphomevalonate decarboxylase